ncbi:NINE protein [Dehalogenimonas sp. 4OHTPN]|uniref:NINE protein n=1 Tax=Dehalogenimonas sp. 4OHTPN TaxID=3166643 RepID=A0AAU8G8K5_9CHLR
MGGICGGLLIHSIYAGEVESAITAITVSDKSRLAVSLFAFFLGVFGAHRWYLGKAGTALLMLLTLGGLGIIWALVDFIMAVSGQMKDKKGRLITKW